MLDFLIIMKKMQDSNKDNCMDKIIVNEAMQELYTIHDILRWAVSCFSAAEIWYGHGTNNPLDEAIKLILPSLWLPLKIPEYMYSVRLTTSEKFRILNRIARRIDERIPVAYLTNKSWFCNHELYVDQRVLIPRSPIAELIKNRFIGIIKNTPNYILDMCTGSGCIAIACAYAYPNAEVDAADISTDALIVAEQNIEAHGLIHNITPICTDLFRNLPKLKYDLIISNPPYVNIEDMHNLPNEYHHEPALGLLAGKNGLEIICRIIACASNYLSEDGILICEVGSNMDNIIKQYPDVPFTWLIFNDGGDGVFMLTRQQIIKSQHYFFLKDQNIECIRAH